MAYQRNFQNLVRLALLLLACLSMSGCSRERTGESRYDVVWETPGEGSLSSMPLGNGDVGMNVWMEKNGDLLFYISKADAFDSGHCLPKLGRIRIRTEPALQTDHFIQALRLADASVEIGSGDARFRIWVDANHPVIRVEGRMKTARKASICLETLRPLISAGEPLPVTGTAGILFDGSSDRLAWCYRNLSSVWADNASKQNSSEVLARVADPIIRRTSGCILQAPGFIRASPASLESAGKTRTVGCTVTVRSSQPGSAQEWLASVPEPVTDWKAHRAWWQAFWKRSYIQVTSCGNGTLGFNQARYTNAARDSAIYEGLKSIDAGLNATQISQRYALERFCQMAAGRGEVPPPFNGSIFTMDMPAGTHVFIDKGTRKSDVNADNRDWNGLPVFWQNTRHPCWSMLARGDYDALLPVFRFIHSTLEISRDRTRRLFGHDGAYMTEGIFWKGVSVFNDLPQHLKYHYLGTLEMTAMMCEYFDHTQDQQFATDILIPCATEFIRFWDLHYPERDALGKRLIRPAGVAETYQPVTNPVSEVSALRYILTRLVGYGENVTGRENRQNWSRFLDEMPEVPTRTVRGMDLLAPGSEYSGRLICETPELYAVWPFKQADLSNREYLSGARQSFHVRQMSLDGTPDNQSWETGGWQPAPIWAATLGLPREAARLVSINFNDRFANFTYENADMAPPVPGHPRARFPAFWETKLDYTPDNDHGGVSANALQNMLLQEGNGKVYLLPAWPEDWDVSFRLHASGNTTIECEYSRGKVQVLQVTPESQRPDIVDCTSLIWRIRNLVEVALADRNYLFGLPAMLDGQPVAGPVTGEWISKYGYTLKGCHAGPWKNSVFTGNTVYVHVPDWPREGVWLSAIPLKLISSESVTGNIRVTPEGKGWRLTGTPDPLNTIVKLVFDEPVGELAMAAPSVGSMTAGKKLRQKWESNDLISVTVDLDSLQQIGRVEFTIENPGHIRGHFSEFELQARQESGDWKTVHNGQVYGTIYSRVIHAFTGKSVRLLVHAPGIRQLDLFPPSLNPGNGGHRTRD